MNKDNIELSRRPKAEEIQQAANDLVASTVEGIDACDNLDILMGVAKKAISISDCYRTKRNAVKAQLMDLAMKL